MNFAKKVLMVVILASMIIPVVGCGVGSTPEENSRTFSRVVDYDARMLVDDLQLLLQVDRPFRGSRWVLD